MDDKKLTKTTKPSFKIKVINKETFNEYYDVFIDIDDSSVYQKVDDFHSHNTPYTEVSYLGELDDFMVFVNGVRLDLVLDEDNAKAHRLSRIEDKSDGMISKNNPLVLYNEDIKYTKKDIVYADDMEESKMKIVLDLLNNFDSTATIPLKDMLVNFSPVQLELFNDKDKWENVNG